MSPRKCCQVRHCQFVAEAEIEDFHVCSLHDAPATRGILEELKLPVSYWANEHPVVMPGRDLRPDDLELEDAPYYAIFAHEDENVLAVDFSKPNPIIFPAYDLARGRT